MLGGFIKYLEESDWKDRGYHDAAIAREQRPEPRKPKKKRAKRRRPPAETDDKTQD